MEVDGLPELNLAVVSVVYNTDEETIEINHDGVDADQALAMLARATHVLACGCSWSDDDEEDGDE